MLLVVNGNVRFSTNKKKLADDAEEQDHKKQLNNGVFRGASRSLFGLKKIWLKFITNSR